MKMPLTWCLAAACGISVGLVTFSGCTPKPPDHGTRFTVQVGAVTNQSEQIPPEAIAATKQALEARLDRLDAEAYIEITNGSYLLVNVPRMDSRKLDSLRLAVARQGLLSLRLVHPQSDELVNEPVAPVGYDVMTLDRTMSGGAKASETVLVKQTMETGFPKLIVQRAYATKDPMGFYEIGFELTPRAAQTFARTTRDHVGQRLAIMFDDHVYSAPVIRSEIPGGRAMISGAFTGAEAHELAVMLETPLPEPISLVEETSY